MYFYMKNKKNEPSFWITNFSKRNISVGDLYLTVPAHTSLNLLDKKHYHYTLEQLQKSAESGSIFKKRLYLSVRKIEPTIIKNNIQIKETYLPTRSRSSVEIHQEEYDEILLT